MFSSTRRLVVPLFVYLSLLLATVEGHDSLHLRDHANLNAKRLMKKRSPLGSGPDLIPPPVVDAGAIPVVPTSVSQSSSSVSVSQTSASVSATSVSASSTSAQSSTSSSSSSSASQSVSASSTSSSVASSTSASPTSETLNLTNAPAPGVSTVVPTVTHTSSVSAASDGAVAEPVSGSSAPSAKSTTLTVIIAIAASVGGVAILWTIFRKWKLSSSEKFDQRLNPIDWQPTSGDDNVIPTHRRASSGASSFHSGSGHSHPSRGAGYGGAPNLEHDFTAIPNANSVPVGGYADLSRGPSPLPPMQEHLTRGPSFNRSYDNGVPLHHQVGYGTQDAYDYNGGATRY